MNALWFAAYHIVNVVSNNVNVIPPLIPRIENNGDNNNSDNNYEDNKTNPATDNEIKRKRATSEETLAKLKYLFTAPTYQDSEENPGKNDASNV
jgi:hypothetical protein